MNKKIGIFLTGFCLTIGYVWANPPQNIQVGYDLSTQTIHIEADHPTDRMERYFVRRVVVIKNNDQTQDFYFPRQMSK